MSEKISYFNDYDFLSLYSFVQMAKSGSTVIYNQELENNLYYLYDNPEYSVLFSSLKVDEEENVSYVSLHTAFAKAYSYGLLNSDNTGENLKSFITISKTDAKLFLNNFEENEVQAMINLYKEIQQKQELFSKLNSVKKLSYEIEQAEKLIEHNKKLQMEIEEFIQKEQELLENIEDENVIRVRKKDTSK